MNLNMENEINKNFNSGEADTHHVHHAGFTHWSSFYTFQSRESTLPSCVATLSWCRVSGNCLIHLMRSRRNSGNWTGRSRPTYPKQRWTHWCWTWWWKACCHSALWNCQHSGSWSSGCSQTVQSCAAWLWSVDNKSVSKPWRQTSWVRYAPTAIVATTTDCWSPRGWSYIGGMAHWIDTDTLERRYVDLLV